MRESIPAVAIAVLGLGAMGLALFFALTGCAKAGADQSLEAVRVFKAPGEVLCYAIMSNGVAIGGSCFPRS